MTKSPSVAEALIGCWAAQGIPSRTIATSIAPKNCINNLVISHLCGRKIYHKLKSAAHANVSYGPLFCRCPVNRLQRVTRSLVREVVRCEEFFCPACVSCFCHLSPGAKQSPSFRRR